jgi:hypothetical protein
MRFLPRESASSGVQKRYWKPKTAESRFGKNTFLRGRTRPGGHRRIHRRARCGITAAGVNAMPAAAQFWRRAPLHEQQNDNECEERQEFDEGKSQNQE